MEFFLRQLIGLDFIFAYPEGMMIFGFTCTITLNETMLQNYGAFLEKDGAGIRGKIKLSGFKNGDIDLSKLLWTYQVCI